jgi:hypothetical protein
MIENVIHRQVIKEALCFLNEYRSVLPEDLKFLLFYFCTTTPFPFCRSWQASCMDRVDLRLDSVLNTEEAMMGLTGKLMIVLCGLLLSLTMPAYAQLGSGQQDAGSILSGMPPDVLAKVRSLAQILQQGLKEGKISEADIQQGVTSGQLGEKLKQLSPEASQLFDDISDASKQGKGPGEESLMPLMGGLGVSPN